MRAWKEQEDICARTYMHRRQYSASLAEGEFWRVRGFDSELKEKVERELDRERGMMGTWA